MIPNPEKKVSEDLNIYDLDDSFLIKIILSLGKNESSIGGMPINFIFSRLLRSIEINPVSLIRRIRRRRKFTLKNTILIYEKIFELFLLIYQRTGDIRYLNCLLKLDDCHWKNFGYFNAIVHFFWRKSPEMIHYLGLIKSHLIDLEASNKIFTINISPNFLTDTEVNEFVKNISFDEYSGGVVVFCPNIRSLYTLCVCELLRLSGVKISAVIVKRVFNYSRIVDEVSRDGVYWVFKKFFQRYLFRGFSESVVAARSLAHLSRLLKIDHLDVDSWARISEVSVIHTNDFNSIEHQNFLKNLSVKLGVFTGGGLIRRNILEVFGLGIINCHGGILPAYRGLDVEKWAILENNPNALGCCAHLMSVGVDEGDILVQYITKLEKQSSLDRIGYNLEYPQCILLCHAVLGLLGGQIIPLNQNKDDGRQFFYMHKSISHILKRRLAI